MTKPVFSNSTLNTSMGDIVIELFPNHAPKTVANFVELATGAKEWVIQILARKLKQIFTMELFFTESFQVL